MEINNNRDENGFLILVKSFEAACESAQPKRLVETEYLKLSEYYRDNANYQQAHFVLKELLTYYPYSSQAHYKRAELFYQEKKMEAALEALEMASVYSPNDLDAVLLKADILNENGKNEEALAILESAPTSNDMDLSDVLLYKAMIYERLHNLDEMFESTKLSLLIDPFNEEALEHIWWCVELTGRYEESIELHLELLDKRTYSYLAWYNLGYAYFNVDNFEEAAEALEYATIINSNFHDGFLMAGEAYIQIENYSKALDLYSELLIDGQDKSEIYTKMGICHLNNGQPVTAYHHFKKAVRINQKNAMAHYHIGEYYSHIGQLKKAIEAYLIAMQLEAKNEVFYAAIAEAFEKQGDLEKALPFYQQAADIAADIPDYWTLLVVFYMNQENFSEALKVIEESKSCTTGDGLLLCEIVCLFHLNDRIGAEFLLRQFMSNNHEKAENLFEYGPELYHDFTIRSIITAFNPN